MSHQTVDNGHANVGRLARILGWGGAAALLLLPLVAMQFTHEVNWTAIDFATFGALLAFTGGCIEVGARMSRNILYRLSVGITAMAIFFSLWINMAVGIVGDEANQTNWMIASVLLVPIVGSVLVRFRPAGMALVMFTAAAAQAAVAVIALTVLKDPALTRSLAPLLGLTAVFVGMFSVSGALFRRVANDEASAAGA